MSLRSVPRCAVQSGPYPKPLGPEDHGRVDGGGRQGAEERLLLTILDLDLGQGVRSQTSLYLEVGGREGSPENGLSHASCPHRSRRRACASGTCGAIRQED